MDCVGQDATRRDTFDPDRQKEEKGVNTIARFN